MLTIPQVLWFLSAYSRELFGNEEMRLIRRSIISTDTLGQLLSGKQAIGLDHIALAVDPLGLNRVEPRALRRQQKRQNTHACVRLLDLVIVLANPGANGLT